MDYLNAFLTVTSSNPRSQISSFYKISYINWYRSSNIYRIINSIFIQIDQELIQSYRFWKIEKKKISPPKFCKQLQVRLFFVQNNLVTIQM